jgi:MoxR-like ATPase
MNNIVQVKMSDLTVWQKIQLLRRQLSRDCLEREYEIDALLALFITKQHGLMLGKPGTGKTFLLEKICTAVASKSEFFDMLVMADSRLEEFFGALSISALKENEIYKRNTKGKLPRATFAYLDEIFKLNSATLNALLKLINERVFYNPNAESVPLRTLVGSSNELPEDKAADALVDRFTWKTWVHYLKDSESTKTLWKRDVDGYTSAVTVKLTTQDLDQAWVEVQAKVGVKSCFDLLDYLKVNLAEQGFEVSDRKWLQINRFLRAFAWIRGEDTITLQVIKTVLADCIWNKESEIKPVKSAIVKLLDDWQQVLESFKDGIDLMATQTDSALSAGNVEEANKCFEAAEKMFDKVLVGINQGFHLTENLFKHCREAVNAIENKLLSSPEKILENMINIEYNLLDKEKEKIAELKKQKDSNQTDENWFESALKVIETLQALEHRMKFPVMNIPENRKIDLLICSQVEQNRLTGMIQELAEV